MPYSNQRRDEIKWFLPNNSVHVPPLDTLPENTRGNGFVILEKSVKATFKCKLIIKPIAAIDRKSSNTYV